MLALVMVSASACTSGHKPFREDFFQREAGIETKAEARFKAYKERSEQEAIERAEQKETDKAEKEEKQRKARERYDKEAWTLEDWNDYLSGPWFNYKGGYFCYYKKDSVTMGYSVLDIKKQSKLSSRAFRIDFGEGLVWEVSLTKDKNVIKLTKYKKGSEPTNLYCLIEGFKTGRVKTMVDAIWAFGGFRDDYIRRGEKL